MSGLTIETFEGSTKELVEALKKSFQEKVAAENADFSPEDLARVQTDDLWMKRFLAAQEYDVKLATQMLYETCQWRKQTKIAELDHTKLLPSAIEKGVLFIRGKDKWGKPLLVFKAKFHNKGVFNIEDIQKFIVYYFERIERESKSDQISVIFDMKDTGWSNMDMDFIRYLITLLKCYYPWFVNYLMIFEMPWLLKSAWNIIKGWLPAKFVDRVKFVDKKTIGDFIDEDNQLVDWGGRDDYKYTFIPEVRNRATSGGKAAAEPSSSEPATRASRISTNSTLTMTPMASPQGSPVMPAKAAANGKLPPEVKARKAKVKFTGSDGGVDRTDVNVRSAASGRNVAQQASEEVRTRTPEVRDRQQQLADVDETITFTSLAGIVQGSFEIQNLTQQTLIIKVKTTGPDNYRVRPTIGLIEGEATAPINVFVHEGVLLRRIPNDRFQVQVALVPPGFPIDTADADSGAGSHNIHFADLQNQWRTIVDPSGVYIETHRLTCIIDPRIALPPPSSAVHGGDSASSTGRPGHVTMNEDDMRRGLSQLEQRLTATITARIDEKAKFIEHLIYATMVLICFVGIILYFRIPSAAKLDVINATGSIDSGLGAVSGNIPLEDGANTCVES